MSAAHFAAGAAVGAAAVIAAAVTVAYWPEPATIDPALRFHADRRCHHIWTDSDPLNVRTCDTCGMLAPHLS